MKVTICHSCGLAMHSASTKCKRCNDKTLSTHDIYCDQDTFTLNKRIEELSRPFKKGHHSQILAAATLIGIVGATLVIMDMMGHPGGFLARSARAAVGSVVKTSVAALPKEYNPL